MERKHTYNCSEISVVIPTYNREKYLMRAINSALGFKEIIIIDDGSTDNTKSLFKKTAPNIKYFCSSKNKGVNAARNLGVKKSKGKYILFLDSDDELTKNAENIITSTPINPLTFFSTKNSSNNKRMSFVKIEKKYTYKEYLQQKVKGEFIPLIDKKIFNETMFSEERFCFESFFWNKVIRVNSVYVSPKICRIYHYDSGNQVSNKLIDPKFAKKRQSDYLEYIKQFKKDYNRYRLKHLLDKIYIKTIVYSLLCADKKTARKIGSKCNVLINIGTLTLSMLPTPIVIKAYTISMKNRG